jgi:type II secretory pathway pseudopilin PulG
LKIRFLNPGAKSFPSRNRAGMTLVEVVMALGITALTVAGIVSGYIYTSNVAVQDSLDLTAITQAQARIEEAHSAQWDVSAYPAVDQLVASNFPDRTVILNLPDSTTVALPATVHTTITQISVTPPLKLIHVDCTWLAGSNPVTISVETIRAPDQ